MPDKVAVGIVNLACGSIARCAGLTRTQLLLNAGLDEQLLANPDDTISAAALLALFRFARRQTRDPALGFRLARVLDLREQGVWGYVMLSSASLRERLEAHVPLSTHHIDAPRFARRGRRRLARSPKNRALRERKMSHFQRENSSMKSRLISLTF